MKKYLLLILTMLSVSIGTWAGSSYTEWVDSRVVIRITDDPDLDNFTDNNVDFTNSGNIKIVGAISQTGLTKYWATVSSGKRLGLDMTEGSIFGSWTSIPVQITHIVFTAGTTLPSESALATGNNLAYAYSGPSGGEANLYVSSSVTSLSEIPELTSDKSVTIKLTGDPNGTVKSLLESAGYTVTNPYDGIASAVGGSVKTDVETILTAAGGTAAEVTTLTVTSGTLTYSGADNDIDYITTSLTGLTTLDISAATASSADDVWTLLNMSSLTSITLGSSNLTTLKGVSGKTFTPALLAKIADNSYTASSFAKELSTDNYVLDGTTLYVTGVLTAERLEEIRTNFPSITTLDVSNCTNSDSQIQAITDSDIPSSVSIVSLPSSGNITYSGSQATALTDGAVEINVATAGQLSTVAENLKAAILEAEHVTITGTLNDTDLAWLSNLANNSEYSEGTSHAVTKTIDLSSVTLAEGASWSNLTGDFSNAGLLLPYGITTGLLTNANLFGISGNALFAEKLVASTFNEELEFFAQNKNKSIVVTAEDVLSVSGVNTVINPTTLAVTGVLTDEALQAVSALGGSQTTLNFSNVSSVAPGINWSNLTGPATVEYILLPASESANVNKFSIVRLPALKAVGAYSNNVGYAHLYAEATGGALPTLSTTFGTSDGYNVKGLFATAGITKLVVSGHVEVNDLDLDGTNVMSAPVLDLSGALVEGTGSLALSAAADIIAPDYSTLTEMEAYVKSYVQNVYAHGSGQFYICVGYTPAALTNASSYLKTGENTVAVRATETHELSQTGVTALNDLNVTTLNLSDVVFANADDITIANTHITKLIATDISSHYYTGNTGRIINISGCTSLTEADFTGARMQRLDATGMSSLKTLIAAEVGMPALPAGTTVENYDTYVTASTDGIINVTGTYTNTDFVVEGDEDFEPLRVFPRLAQANVEKITGAAVEITVDLADMTGETDTFDKLLTAALEAYNVGKTDAEKGTLKTISILHINTTNNTKLSTTELSYLVNLKKLGVLDIKNADISDLTTAQIANGLKDANSNMRDIALVIPTPDSKQFNTGHTEVGSYQAAGVKCIAYNPWARQADNSYAKNTNKFHIYGTNSVVAKLAPLTTATNFSIVFLPLYNAEGNFSDYPTVESGFIENTLSQFDCVSINMMWLSHYALGYDFSTLNTATHYIVIPHNSSSASALHKNDIVGRDSYSGSDYIYGTHNSTDGIWAVFVYAGAASPYSGGISFDGEFIATQGDYGTGETTSVIYIRETSKLTTAENIFSDLQRDAYRTIILGNAAGTDLSAINQVHSTKIDLSKVHLTNVDMTSCANSYVEYLALPTEGDPDQFIPANFKAANKCPNLKALGMYHSNSDATTDALNKLYYASWMAGSARTIIEMIPESAPVCSYKMWGPLNNLDISNGNITNGAFYQRASTLIQSADLSMAWFPNQDHMNFSAASAYGTSGATGFQSCELPRTNMTIIPAQAFDNMQALTQIAIPDIYTTIKTNAFHLCTVLNQMDVYDITVSGETDLDDVVYGSTGHESVYNYNSDNALIKEVITNGPQTVTLPASLGNAEGEGLYEGSMQLSEKITDVYVLATVAPRCAADAFGSVAYVGNNTFAGVQAHPFARDKYRMSYGSATPEEETKWIAMLHFPAETSAAEAANYTDLTREYSLYDEEGNLDGEGNPIQWPNQGEMLRSFNQARTGVTWDAWDDTRDANYEPPYGAWNTASPELGTSPSYNTNYMGWHQFALCASYSAPIVEPTEETVEYEQTNWFTICLPYNLTKAQLIKYLGIPASVTTGDAIVHNTLDNVQIDEDKLPDIRTMIGVTRTKEKASTKNKITIQLSKNLAKDNNDVNVGLRGPEYVAASESNYLKGGYPYFIKAYLPSSIKSQMGSLSLGALTMMRITRSSDAATILAQTGNTVNSDKTANEAVLAPKEIKVQAQYVEGANIYFAKKDDTQDTNETEDDDDFIYGFQGQYWDQLLPLGCYYLAADQNFYRATTEDPNNPGWSIWSWKPYVAVITPKAGKTETSVIKNGEAYQRSYSEVFSAEDDSFAGTTWARPTYELVFDDDIIEVGEDGSETTAIEQVEGGAFRLTTGKIFNMAGQYVGDSLNGLPKGMYIVNGKKVVIK